MRVGWFDRQKRRRSAPIRKETCKPLARHPYYITQKRKNKQNKQTPFGKEQIRLQNIIKITTLREGIDVSHAIGFKSMFQSEKNANRNKKEGSIDVK